MVVVRFERRQLEDSRRLLGHCAVHPHLVAKAAVVLDVHVSVLAQKAPQVSRWPLDGHDQEAGNENKDEASGIQVIEQSKARVSAFDRRAAPIGGEGGDVLLEEAAHGVAFGTLDAARHHVGGARW